MDIQNKTDHTIPLFNSHSNNTYHKQCHPVKKRRFVRGDGYGQKR